MSIKKFLLITLVAVSSGLLGCASSPSSDGEIDYTALGASDAVGIGAIPINRGYVFRIKDRLEAQNQNVRLVNLGIPGGQADDIQKIADIVVPGAQPELVTLWTGANDLIDGDNPEEFERELEDILERLDESTEAFVVIGDLPDLTRLPRFVDRPSRVVTRERVDAFNAVIMRQADRFDVPIARLSELDMLNELTSDIDGFHPNNLGHRMIGDKFLEVIIPGLGLR